MAISGLCHAGFRLREPTWQALAERAFHWVVEHLADEGRLSQAGAQGSGCPQHPRRFAPDGPGRRHPVRAHGRPGLYRHSKRLRDRACSTRGMPADDGALLHDRRGAPRISSCAPARPRMAPPPQAMPACCTHWRGFIRSPATTRIAGAPEGILRTFAGEIRRNFLMPSPPCCRVPCNSPSGTGGSRRHAWSRRIAGRVARPGSQRSSSTRFLLERMPCRPASSSRQGDGE